MADSVYPARVPRYQETFPALTAQEIDRLRRYGSLRKYSDGEKLFEAGKDQPRHVRRAQGQVAITQRDGLGHVAPIAEQGEGQFLADVGQLSTRATLVDGTAEGDVETLLIPTEGLRALLVAEADLGERIMRALILRRVALLQGGAAGAVLIGSPDAADVIRLEGFLTRNGYPHHLLDPARDLEAKEVIAPLCRYRGRIASGGLSRRLGARQSIGSGCVTPDRLDGSRRDRTSSTTSRWLAPDRRASRPRSMAAPKA